MPEALDEATAARVQERAAALESIDARLSQILEKSAASIEVIQTGSQQEGASQEAIKEQFTNAMREYQDLVLSVNADLRKEVELLHNAWQKDVLPLNLQAKASTFGRQKEDEIWQQLFAQLSEPKE